ncbi:ribosome assembly RNA-binding protein YhbY [Uliginosibacterium sediminicola]|uniref:Ribosome assembly RNA-binding protein YhbY n=1 Tax=Uliginosibacterium sediminicola TaxID=2024550 RepID=A0ABU9Z0R2_9RHOO
MFELKPIQRRELRAKAHHLDPVVSIAGNGLTENVIKEIDAALKAHELIKIRVYGDDRDARVGYLQEICKQLDCAAVQSIGKLLVVFRPQPKALVVKEAPAKSGKAATPRTAARPTTKAPPRAKLRGVSERVRKTPLGSARPKKSAR